MLSLCFAIPRNVIIACFFFCLQNVPTFWYDRYLISVGVTDKNVARVRNVDPVWIFRHRIGPNLPQKLTLGTDDHDTVTLFNDRKDTFLASLEKP